MLARAEAAIEATDMKSWCKVLLKVFAFACTALSPGVFNGIIYYGTPADITMAIVYGTLLLFDKAYTDVPVFSRYSPKTIFIISVNHYTTVNRYINNALDMCRGLACR